MDSGPVFHQFDRLHIPRTTTAPIVQSITFAFSTYFITHVKRNGHFPTALPIDSDIEPNQVERPSFKSFHHAFPHSS